MKRRKLRVWVKPTALVVLLITITIGASYSLLSNLNDNLSGNFTTNVIVDDAEPVVEEIETIVKPYEAEGVSISKNFYNKDDDESKQINSLILYENIYVQNTGILYSSDDAFDVISVADGVVKNIKEDKILGTIIEIENSDSLTTVYESISEETVKIGDQIKKGTKIATSGNNNLTNEKDNCLLFQVYINGNLVNPETIYGVDIDTINE